VSAASDAAGRAIQSVTQLRTAFRRVRNQRQVRALGEKRALAALSQEWYDRDRKPISKISSVRLDIADADFTQLLELSDRAPSRASCMDALQHLREELISIRSQVVAAESVAASSAQKIASLPEFDSVISNPAMRHILARRWQEIERCLSAGANLAAMVMMGGLLEALVMARIERLADKKPVFTAKAAPKDKVGKTLPQKDWTLHNYIEISHELGWIGETARSVGVVLRDYRNYIHPYKELSEGTTLTNDDAAMLWTVSVTLTDQILRSTSRT
jgi:hypothetical protein